MVCLCGLAERLLAVAEPQENEILHFLRQKAQKERLKMKWLTNLGERYERWRVKSEQDMVRDVLVLMRNRHLKEEGILIVEKEEEIKNG